MADLRARPQHECLYLTIPQHSRAPLQVCHVSYSDLLDSLFTNSQNRANDIDPDHRIISAIWEGENGTWFNFEVAQVAG